MSSKATFDANGSNLWAEMDMKGIYRIIYEYDLWSKEAGKPVILTKDSFRGSNEDDHHPDFTEVRNEYVPAEPLSDFDGYEVAVSFKIIKKGDNDEGYRVGIVIKQGPLYESAQVIGSCYTPADKNESTRLGEAVSVKEEYLVITLKSS